MCCNQKSGRIIFDYNSTTHINTHTSDIPKNLFTFSTELQQPTCFEPVPASPPKKETRVDTTEGTVINTL